jgi:hypothetical protein
MQPRAPAEPADRHGQASKPDRAIAGTGCAQRASAGLGRTGPRTQCRSLRALMGAGTRRHHHSRARSLQYGPEPRQGRPPHQCSRASITPSMSSTTTPRVRTSRPWRSMLACSLAPGARPRASRKGLGIVN